MGTCEPSILHLRKAALAAGTFVGVIALAALNVAPIAATALIGAVLLILLRVIGIAMDQSGLASQASGLLIASVEGLSPLVALITLYGATMFLTELFLQRHGRETSDVCRRRAGR